MNSKLLILDEVKLLLACSDAVTWRDEDGNSLLHHAARLGDKEAVEQCLAQGIKTLASNKENEPASTVASIWGHDALAKMIDDQMRRERAETPPPFVYASLQEIRDKSSASGSNLFYQLAQPGVFDQVIALAKKHPGNLTAVDILSAGENGEKVILKICREGLLPLLMQPELWSKNTAEFLSIWAEIPKMHQKDQNIDDFINRCRQVKLQSLPSKIQWKNTP